MNSCETCIHCPKINQCVNRDVATLPDRQGWSTQIFDQRGYWLVYGGCFDCPLHTPGIAVGPDHPKGGCHA